MGEMENRRGRGKQSLDIRCVLSLYTMVQNSLLFQHPMIQFSTSMGVMSERAKE